MTMSWMHKSREAIGKLIVFTSLGACATAVPAQSVSADVSALASPETNRALNFRYIGPLGNRVSSVAGVIGNPRIYYAGAASGGIFKTTDGGTTWQAVFDQQPVSSVGSLAVSASNPNVVWAGTGETWIRSNISVGWGIFKSTDAGKTWQRAGLENSGRIGRIVVDPKNPDQVLACALGTGYGPEPDRGVFRTADGGKTWSKVLYVDDNTGCSDLAMDPSNPQVLFAGMWQFVVHTWGQDSGGPGSGLFRSVDGGESWKRLEGHGLPEQEVGKIAVSIAPSDAKRVYAIIETGTGEPFHGKPTSEGELWRSEDGGDNWQMVSQSHDVAGRPHYYSRVFINPKDEDNLFFLTASLAESMDGGKTLKVTRGYPLTPGGHVLVTPPLGDFHDMWIDSSDPARRILSNDGGVGITVDGGATWNRIQLANAQLYHADVDNQIPYFVYGNRQDGPSFRGPSNSLVFGYGHFAPTISMSEWTTVAGGESGRTIPDPTDPNIIWNSGTGAGPIGGTVDRYDQRSRQYRAVEVWPDDSEGSPAKDVKYRFHWTFPIAMDPFDHNRVWAGSQFVHETTDAGQSWHLISPDLTLNDKSKQGPSGGLTGDNIGPEYGDALMAISPSPKQKDVLWAGSNDGQVNVTKDGGKTWVNVSKNIPGLPPWGTVYCITPSPFDAARAYIAVDLHQQNDFDPYAYKTADFGRSWTKITNGIPKSPLSYAHNIFEDPFRAGLLFLGTENAFYFSYNDGADWLPLQNNLPHAPVYGMTEQKNFHDLVIATYGRGFWILDDITPLEQMTPEVAQSAAYLFAPRKAYRFRGYTTTLAPSYEPSQGFNPPPGADLNYYLKAKSAEPVSISIMDAGGTVVRTLPASNHAGINRIWWNLESSPFPSDPVLLRTHPVGASWMKPGPNGRRIQGALSILAPPGIYTVQLTVGDQKYTRKLTLLKDPHSQGTQADIEAQTAFVRTVQANMISVGKMINQIEVIRAQLENLPHPSASLGVDALDAKFIEFEERLYSVRVTGGQDGMRWPAGLISKLSHVASQAQEADDRPTNQELAVNAMYTKEIKSWQPELVQLISQDVAAFNQKLIQQNLEPIDTTVPAPLRPNPSEERESAEPQDDSAVVPLERPAPRAAARTASGGTL
jgi:photosystem II stability/assembly factor-like uncharacterized protein